MKVLQPWQTKVDSATEGVMPDRRHTLSRLFYTVLRGNLTTKLHFPKFPTGRNCPILPYKTHTLFILTRQCYINPCGQQFCSFRSRDTYIIDHLTFPDVRLEKSYWYHDSTSLKAIHQRRVVSSDQTLTVDKLEWSRYRAYTFLTSHGGSRHRTRDFYDFIKSC